MARPKKKGVIGIKLRLATELLSELEAAAKRHKISFNAEAVDRLGRSFAEEDQFGGEAGRRWLYFITTAFVYAGERNYRDRNPKQKARLSDALDISLWIDDPEAYAAAMLNAVEQLMLHQPGVTPEACRLQLLDLQSRIATHFLQQKQVRP